MFIHCIKKFILYLSLSAFIVTSVIPHNVYAIGRYNNINNALSDGLLATGISKYKQEEFIKIWVYELKAKGFSDKQIIEVINSWANQYKEFFGTDNTYEEETENPEETDTDDRHIDIADIVEQTNQFSIKGNLLKFKNAVKSLFVKFAYPFIYKYSGSNENGLTEKEIKKMESNIKFFSFIQLMLGFELASSFSTIYMTTGGYSLAFISAIMSTLGIISFATSAVTGFITSKISKRTIVVVSLITHTLGSVSFTLINLSPVFLVLSQVLPTIGVAGLSVSLSPFFYGSLEALGEQESFQQRYGSSMALFWLVMSLSSLAGGAVALITGQFSVVVLAAALDVIITTSALFKTHKEIHNTDFEDDEDELAIFRKQSENNNGKKDFKHHIKKMFEPAAKLYKNKKAVPLIIINIFVNNIFFVTLSLLQPALVTAGLNTGLLSVVYFAANIVQSLASQFITKISPVAGNKILRAFFIAAMPLLLMQFIATMQPVYLISVFILMNFWQGAASLSETNSVYETLSNGDRSKWLSLKAVFGTIISTLTQTLITFALAEGIKENIIITAGSLIATAAGIFVPLIAERKRNFNISKENFDIPNFNSVKAVLVSA